MTLAEQPLALRGENMITITQSGNFDKTTKFLDKMRKRDVRRTLSRYGELGVKALSEATPVKTGKTASSWKYEIVTSRGSYNIYWSNTNVNKGVNIAMIIQYGHGTRQGAYVKGIDYINPALQPVFDQMAEELWKEVVNS